MKDHIIIDGTKYEVPIVSLKRKADILDKFAYRDEEGELHREVIGTYYNYTLEIGVFNDDELYNSLFLALSEPTAYHDVILPTDGISFRGYFGSVNDEVRRLTDDGAKYRGLNCNLIAVSPTKRPTGRGSL